MAVVDGIERAPDDAQACGRCHARPRIAGAEQVGGAVVAGVVVGWLHCAGGRASGCDGLPHGLEQRPRPSPVTAEIAQERQLPVRDMGLEPLDALGIVERIDLGGHGRSAAWRRPPGRRGAVPRRMVSKSSTGSRPDAPDTSTRCTSTLVRSMWRRNWWPRPWPWCAPLISPGRRRRRSCDRRSRPTHAEVRHERGERIVGDLRDAPPRCARSAWTCRRSGSRSGRRRRSASARGEGTSLRPARPARCVAARGWWTRRTARCRGRRAALRDEHALAFVGQVGQQGTSCRPDPSRRPACRWAPRSRDRHRLRRCGWSLGRAGRARRLNSGWKRKSTRVFFVGAATM